MKNRILVVEDDAAIRDAVLLNLQFADYDAVAFDDGKRRRMRSKTITRMTLRFWTSCCPAWTGLSCSGSWSDSASLSST